MVQDLSKELDDKRRSVTIEEDGSVEWNRSRSLSLERELDKEEQIDKDLLDLSMVLVSLISALGAEAFSPDPVGMSISEIKRTLADIIQRRTGEE